jgi:hypothetical protein
LNTYYEVIRQTLDLAETGQDCIAHLPQPLEIGDFELALRLYQDFIQSYVQMNESLDLLKNEYDISRLDSSAAELQEALIRVLAFLEKQDYQEARVSIENQLHPSYIQWKEQLIAILQPNIMS